MSQPSTRLTVGYQQLGNTLHKTTVYQTTKYSPQMAEARGIEAFINHQHALIERHDQYQFLKNIQVRTLISCGTYDRPCPFNNHKLMLQSIPNAVLEVIPDAGHLPALEQPTKTNLVIRDWL